MPSFEPARGPAQPRFDFASRLFGYDLFISFALGPPPRGSQSYASDLARRLRERDFKVFYSESEAAPGEQLDSTLRKALHSSRALIVVANRGTLKEPRWVRVEVESFGSLTPARPIVPISIGAALQDAELAAEVAPWLPFKDRIWIDESQSAADIGVVSEAVVDRLALVPRRIRSNVKWRWLVRAVGTALLLLAVGLGIAAKVASDNDKRARVELMRSVSLRAAGEAQAMVAGVRAGGHERALQQVLAARSIGGAPIETSAAMLSLLLETERELKVTDIGAVIRSVAFSPAAGGTQVVTGDAVGRVQRWDASTLQPIGGPLPGPQREVFAVAYSPDGQTLAAGDLEGRLWLWKAGTGEPRNGAAQAAGGAIRGLAFMPDGRRIVSAGVGGALQFWDASSGEPQGEPLPGMGEVIAALAVSPDGQHLASGGDYHAQLWSQRRGHWESLPLDDPQAASPSWVRAVAFSPDGRRLATGSDDGLVRLWDVATGRLDGAPLRAKAAVTSLRYSRDGTQLLCGDARGTLGPWNLQERRPGTEWLKNQNGAVSALGVSGDGRLVVSGGEDGLLRLWNAGTQPTLDGALPPQRSNRCDDAGREVPQALRHGRRVGFAADCKLAAVGGPAGTLRLHDGHTGEPLGPAVAGHVMAMPRDADAKEPKVNVVSVAVSGDGRFLVSGSENGSIQRWQISPLAPVGPPMLGHGSGLSSVALSDDGRTIASVDIDGQFRLWDWASGQPIGSPLTQQSANRIAAFSADGKSIIALDSESRVLQLWPTPSTWPARLCDKTTQDMSPEQWSAWLTPEIAYRRPCDLPAVVVGHGR